MAWFLKFKKPRNYGDMKATRANRDVRVKVEAMEHRVGVTLAHCVVEGSVPENIVDDLLRENVVEVYGGGGEDKAPEAASATRGGIAPAVSCLLFGKAHQTEIRKTKLVSIELRAHTTQ